MYCNNCGNANAEGKFCDVCGAEISSEPVVVNPENVIETTPASDPGKVLGIVSMCLSIFGIVCSPTMILSAAAIIAGLITGIIGKKKSKLAGYKNGFAIAGIIISAVGLALLAIGVLLLVLYIVLVVGLGAFAGIMGAAGY